MLEPELPDRACALFFDFDGTLVDLAPRPSAVHVVADVPALLAELSAALCGAVAVVSGRPLAEIDHFLRPVTLPAAGVHGVERRRADGRVSRLDCSELHEAATGIQALCQRHPALIMEVKPGAMALHYRQAPELEAECLAAMSDALARVQGMDLMRGKRVVELKPSNAGKGHAVRAFMDETPFQRRQPWFFGDDVTDEAAFDAVQALGGVSVKIGEGDTGASHRLTDPAALHGWMRRLAARLGSTRACGESV